MQDLTAEAPPLYGRMQMTNEQYHSADGISKSHLDVISLDNEGCPLEYWDKYLNPDPAPDEETDDKLLGTVFHSAVLEPDLYHATYAVPPLDAPPKPTSRQINAKRPSLDSIFAIEWWDEFRQTHEGKLIIPRDVHETAQAMAAAVRRHPKVGPLFADCEVEQSFFTRDPKTGLLIKCRPDCMPRSGLLVDLKSVLSASPAAFGKSAVNFRYFVQAPWYDDILHDLYGESPGYMAFVCVKKTRPYTIGLYYSDDAMMAAGREQYRKDLDLLAYCKEYNIWPDFGYDASPVQLPGWFKYQRNL